MVPDPEPGGPLPDQHQQPLAEDPPNRLLGRVQTVVSALSWSATPPGTFLGGVAIERTGNAALVYGVIGALILFAAAFSPTSFGRAEHHLSRKEPS